VPRRLAFLLVLTLTACTTHPVPPAPTPGPTVVPLTVTQATKAALEVADLPRGWDGGVAVDPEPTPGSRAQYDPPDCLTFLHPTDTLGRPTTAVRGQYFTRQPLQSVTELVWSWPRRLDTFVPDIAQRLVKCSNYTTTASDRVKYRWVAKQLPVSGLAGGIALRYDVSTADDGASQFAEYAGFVTRGGTVITLDASGDTITDAVFERLVSKAAARLDAVVG
jgi:hypothetical protein